MPARDGYIRAVFVQEMTGFCVDLPGMQLLAAATPQTRERTMRVGGSSRPISRRHSLALPIIRECDISALRDMCAQAWPVTCYLLGWKRHQVWAVASQMDLIDQRRGPSAMAGAAVQLRSTVFDGAIYQGENLLGGVPWQCTESTVVPGTAGSGSGADADYALYREGQTGWQGPFWDPGGAGASVDFPGQLTKSGSEDPSIDLFMPIQGATLRMAPAGVAIAVFFYDWSGALISGSVKATADASKDVLVPDGTWQITVAIDEADQQPQLLVVNAGQALDPRYGIDVGNDKVQSGVPHWTT